MKLPRYLQLARKFFRISKAGLPASESDYKALEQYGVIGNLETCALVAANGSIDWLCLPHLESPSVFASILDKDRGGVFAIQPTDSFEAGQEYLLNTNVLQTHFRTASGEAVFTDFMPPFKRRSVWHKNHSLFRQLTCTRGALTFQADFRPRFNYAKRLPRIRPTTSGVVAEAGQERVFLDAPFPFVILGRDAKSQFTLQEGEEAWFLLQYNARADFSHRACQRELRQTVAFWERWAHKCDGRTCVFLGPWHDLAVRSALVLKLLTHGETGAIAAAVTTSLPEVIGGSRNWDYRYNWIRDSVLTAQALYSLGHLKEAGELLNWYKRLYRKVKVSDIQIMHGLHGENDIRERRLRYLSGYRNSRPVRVGNAAARQRQLDVYGELLNMAYETSRHGEKISHNDWRLLRKIVTYVCRVWQTKDQGIWEARGRSRHFVYSKVMCWVALDRGIKIAQRRGLAVPFELWQKVRDKIYDTVLQRGYSKRLKSFVQSFGSEHLDAANLLIPSYGFLPYEDPRVQGTINQTLKTLTSRGLVYRYRSSDGLPGEEGAFILCTFWLIDALALSGRVEEAERLLRNLTKHASPLGLLAEEIKVRTGEQLGNFPQAFSHIGLINSAFYVGLAKGKQPPRKR